MLASLMLIFTGALFAPLFTRRLSKLGAWLLALLPISLFFYFLSSIPAILEGEVFYSSFHWVPQLDVTLTFSLDGLSLTFALLVLGIGFFILIYAGAYLGGNPRLGQLLSFLLLFMGSMLGLVLAENILTLFIFWEFTSLSSYLLIGFNHQKESSRQGALQALLVTGLGGLALLAGLLLLGQAGQSWEITSLVQKSTSIQNHPYYEAIVLLVLLGAFTKSAQFPFHFWLPNAMAAPTPVSAYLHSATMVKAGVYLVARLTPLLGQTLFWKLLLMTIGGATLLLGACLALAQTDLKRLLAYSTVSALGALMFLLGQGSPQAVLASLVFLVGHALYKGSLFMVAGAVDHAAGSRDLTKLAGLKKSLPWITVAAFLAALSMMGLPPFLGFAAKEMFYETAQQATWPGFWTSISFLSSVFFVFVALRVAWDPFWTKSQGLPKAIKILHPESLSLWLGPLALALGGLALGWGLSGPFGDLLRIASEGLVKNSQVKTLSLWHGFNFTFFLSVLTWLAGVLLFFGKAKVLSLAKRGIEFWKATPEAFYDFLLVGLKKTAQWQTRLLQNGYLRNYVLVIILTTVGLTGFTFFSQFDLQFPHLKYDLYVFEFVLMVLIILASTMATLTSSRMGAMAGLGVVGFGVAMAFILYGAPDLAMTQILVETLVVILLVLGFYHMPGFNILLGRPRLLRDALVALSMGTLMTLLVLAATQLHFTATVSEFYARQSVPQAHGHNVVNTILVDFRALDTLGETVVIALAGLGVFAMLKLKPKKRNKKLGENN